MSTPEVAATHTQSTPRENRALLVLLVVVSLALGSILLPFYAPSCGG